MKEVGCADCGAKNAPRSKYCAQCGMPLRSAPSSTEPKQASSVFGILFVLGVLVPIGLLVYCAFSSSVEGEIQAQGKPFGDYTMKPTDCHSGAHENFFGVWVTPDLIRVDGRQGFKGGIKFVKNHLNEWDVYVESPLECQGLKCAVRPLPRAACTTFHIDVRDTGSLVNEIRVREGQATLDCRLPEGGTFKAKLKFDGCS